jgi:5S rRNA maturation endonuclease (ribonuclease M5)
MRRIEPHVLEAIKARLHLPTIIQGYGIALHKNGWFNRADSYKINCPFHDDKTPSLHLSNKNGKWIWNCFGCPEHGNVLDFKAKMEKKPFIDVYEECARELNLLPSAPGGERPTGNNGHAPLTNGDGSDGAAIPAPKDAPPEVPPEKKAEVLAAAVKHYHQTLLEDRRGPEYLAWRGIKDAGALKTFQIGFVNGSLRARLPKDQTHEHVAALKALGLLNLRGGEIFYNCVVFPIFDEGGAPVGLYGRHVSRAHGHLYLAGPLRGVWNGAAVKAYPEVILTEKIIDALSLYSVGIKNVVPLYGVNGFTEDHVRLFREHRTKSVALCLDNDPAGDRARPLIAERLKSLGVEVADVLLPKEYKDVNDALQKGVTVEKFRGFLPWSAPAVLQPQGLPGPSLTPATGGQDPAPGTFVPAEPARATEALPTEPPQAAGAAAPATTPAVVEKDDGVHFRFGPRAYRAVGLSAKGLDLRVTLRLASGPAGNEVSHIDTFDLYSARARGAFVSCCRKLVEAEEGELLKELNHIIAALERLREKKAADKPVPEGDKMTEAQRAQAQAFLKRSTLLEDVLEHIEVMGTVGEAHNKLYMYFVAVSRKLDDPLSCSVVSQSSSGKSALAEVIEKLTPPEDLYFITSASDKSFYNLGEHDIEHKLIIIEEKAGIENIEYCIRALQSKKRLSQFVSRKDEQTGEIKTKYFVIYGPIAYIDGTTDRINPENATRCAEINTDESLEQTRRINDRQREAATLDGLHNQARQKEIAALHHNMQRLLEPVKVVIPYANHLTFPDGRLRARRDNPRFLSLIRTIAFLRQHQRDKKKTKDGVVYIEAAVEDYDAAYPLAAEIMGESLVDLKKPLRDLLNAVERIQGEQGATRRQIREYTGITDTRLREMLWELVGLEYVRMVSGGGRGNICRYRAIDRGPAEAKRLTGLLTPEELRARLTA